MITKFYLSVLARKAQRRAGLALLASTALASGALLSACGGGDDAPAPSAAYRPAASHRAATGPVRW